MGKKLGIQGGSHVSVGAANTFTAAQTLRGVAATTNVLNLDVTGDTVSRFAVDASGLHLWSSGAAAGDITMKRNAVGQLKIVGGTANSVLVVQNDGNTSAQSAFLVQDSTSGTIFAIGGGGRLDIGAAASTIGFYGATPTAKQTGVAVTAAAIHTALVNLGLIGA